MINILCFIFMQFHAVSSEIFNFKVFSTVEEQLSQESLWCLRAIFKQQTDIWYSLDCDVQLRMCL